MTHQPKILAVLGAGAWGTALANLAARHHAKILLWAHDPAHVAQMRATRRNDRRLPGVALAENLVPIDDLGAIAEADHLLSVVPAQNFRAVAQRLKAHLRPEAALINCAKGIERGTGLYMHQVLAETLPGQPAAALSGPSFAEDVAKGLPTAVTLATPDPALGEMLCQNLGSPKFRLYRSTDLLGVEIGGAAKNVLAIACGVTLGRGLGASAHAALLARGFSELLRFATAQGARSETIMGLSGLGDLALTCSSPQSRNFALGFALGRGEAVEQASHGKLSEGALTATALVAKAQSLGVEMPIAQAVAAVLDRRLTVEAAIDALLTRPFKAED